MPTGEAIRHDAGVATREVASDAGHGAEGALVKILEIVLWVVGEVFEKATDVYMMGAMVAVLGIGWYFGGSIAHSVYMATCAQIHCPHFTNIRCLGMPWGCCIQDVICPCMCHKYRPKFGLRLHIVKARYLNTLLTPKVYCRVWAGNNPLKTTSMQEYNNPSLITGYGSGDIDKTGWKTVIWNEPVDLVIYPSTGDICIVFHNQGMLGDEQTLGQVRVQVGEFYEEDKAVCSYLWFGCCEWCPPCFPTFLFRPQWPMIKGAPSLDDLQEHHAESTRTCFQSISSSLGLDSMAKIGGGLFKEEPMDLTPEETNMNTVTEALADDGMLLELANPQFRKNKETVIIAVRDDPDAMQFASKKLRNDIQIQRIQYKLPEPLMLQIFSSGRPNGYLWVYMILSHEVSCETECRTCIAGVLRTFCCCLGSCIRYVDPKREELPNYQFVGEPVGIEDDF